MIAKLEFNLPEEAVSYKKAIKSDDMYAALWELKGLHKKEDVTEDDFLMVIKDYGLEEILNA